MIIITIIIIIIATIISDKPADIQGFQSLDCHHQLSLNCRQLPVQIRLFTFNLLRKKGVESCCTQNGIEIYQKKFKSSAVKPSSGQSRSSSSRRWPPGRSRAAPQCFPSAWSPVVHSCTIFLCRLYGEIKYKYNYADLSTNLQRLYLTKMSAFFFYQKHMSLMVEIRKRLNLA